MKVYDSITLGYNYNFIQKEYATQYMFPFLFLYFSHKPNLAQDYKNLEIELQKLEAKC